MVRAYSCPHARAHSPGKTNRNMAIYIFDIIRFGIILLALFQFTLTPVRPGNYTAFWNLVAAGVFFFLMTFVKLGLDEAQLGWGIFLTKGTPASVDRLFGIIESASIQTVFLSAGSAVTALMLNKIILNRNENK